MVNEEPGEKIRIVLNNENSRHRQRYMMLQRRKTLQLLDVRNVSGPVALKTGESECGELRKPLRTLNNGKDLKYEQVTVGVMTEGRTWCLRGSFWYVPNHRGRDILLRTWGDAGEQ